MILILTIGVSHGSLDHVKGKRLFNILNIKKISIFYFLYILIAISVIIIWILAPSISLIIFLLVASFHFGKEDTQFLINENSKLIQFLFFFKGFSQAIKGFYFVLINFCISKNVKLYHNPSQAIFQRYEDLQTDKHCFIG